MQQITERVAEWAVALSYEDIPESVRERARLQTASVLGAVLAGSQTELLERIRRAALGWGGGSDASIIPAGPRAPLLTACYVNAAASVAYDFDDYLFAGHTGHSAVIASLAYGEMTGASGEDVMTAQVAANEAGGRLGAALLLGPHNGQMWTYIHTLMGACIGARFLGLDARRARDAIGIALAQPPYPLAPAFFGPDSKTLMASEPLVAGLRAATLAAEGLTGPADILGDEAGVLKKIGSHPLAFTFGALGSAWVTESLAYKVYPGCAYIDTPVDAFAQLQEQFEQKTGRPIEADDIAAVEVEATLFTDGMEQMSAPYRARDPLRAVDVNFSVALSLGVLVACGAITPQTLSARSLAEHREQILAVADRVSVTSTESANARIGGLGDLGIDTIRLFDPSYEPTLDGADFSRFEMRFPARVTLKTVADGEYVAEVEIPRGGPGRPQEETTKLVLEKFLAGAKNVLPHPERALEAVMSYDSIDDIQDLVRLLLQS